jgi:hypothetical protein
VNKGKKTSADFLAGLRSIGESDAVRRHPLAQPAPAPAASAKELPASLQIPQQPSRRGKVAIISPNGWTPPCVSNSRKWLLTMTAHRRRWSPKR